MFIHPSRLCPSLLHFSAHSVVGCTMSVDPDQRLELSSNTSVSNLFIGCVQCQFVDLPSLLLSIWFLFWPKRGHAYSKILFLFTYSNPIPYSNPKPVPRPPNRPHHSPFAPTNSSFDARTAAYSPSFRICSPAVHRSCGVWHAVQYLFFDMAAEANGSRTTAA